MNTSAQPPQLSLAQERFAMLAEIAKELAGEICFPICLDVGIHVSSQLRRPLSCAEELAAIVRIEPLLHVQLLRLGNTPLYNPEQATTTQLEEAIARIGLDNARQAMLAMANRQLLNLKDLASFGQLAHKLWLHSLSTAAAAQVLASTFTRLSPEEAFLAGLIHDFGIFYMLYKANQNPELRTRPESLQYVTVQWHESIGETLAHGLGLPMHIVEAIRDHDQPRRFIAMPRTLADVVFVANLLSDASYEWQRNELPPDAQQREELRHPPYVALFPKIAAMRESLLSNIKL